MRLHSPSRSPAAQHAPTPPARLFECAEQTRRSSRHRRAGAAWQRSTRGHVRATSAAGPMRTALLLQGAKAVWLWVRKNDNGNGSKGPHVHWLVQMPIALACFSRGLSGVMSIAGKLFPIPTGQISEQWWLTWSKEWPSVTHKSPLRGFCKFAWRWCGSYEF